MSEKHTDETYSLPKFSRTLNRNELRKKKAAYWIWLDTPKGLRDPVLAKDAERRLAVSHPVFVDWGKEYKAQKQLGLRMKVNTVKPADMAGYLLEKMEATSRLSASPESNDPKQLIRDQTEATAWVTVDNILRAVNDKLINVASPGELISLAKGAVDVLERTQRLIVERLPILKQEMQRLRTEEQFGQALQGIVLPGETPQPAFPPSQTTTPPPPIEEEPIEVQPEDLDPIDPDQDLDLDPEEEKPRPKIPKRKPRRN